MNSPQRGSDFSPPDLVRPPEESERRKAIVVCAQYAQDKSELQTFVQMLGLVDELV